ncbi:MAG: 3-deoxy-manno-octulosonate cytidylyltransferase, partial [bacterium]|nr:3-deoxy-manno-octulosonate cytidylyltransferase [bacterium]
PDHASGTDRVAEIARRHGEFDVVLNVQGDEPAIAPRTISAVAHAFLENGREIVTAVSPLEDDGERGNPNVVKAVLAQGGRALYFSRAAIPFLRGAARVPFYRHQGIYGFRSDILKRATALPVSNLERAESLEQLRWLENGLSIHCVVVPAVSVGVDVPSDVPIAETLLKSQEK